MADRHQQPNKRARHARRQHVWIVRYGLTHPPLVEGVGPYNMDIEPTEGVDHAEKIGDRIAKDSIAGPNGAVPSVVFSSPFLRTAHTADIIAKKLSAAAATDGADGSVAEAVPVPVRIEEGLTEWLTPSLVVVEKTGERCHPNSAKELVKSEGFDTIDVGYDSLNPEKKEEEAVENKDDDRNTPVAVPPRFPEGESSLLLRCRTTIRLLLESIPPGTDLVVVSHAPCIQSVAYALEGAPSTKESKLGPWPLGGITLFSREVADTSENGGGEDAAGDADSSVAATGGWTMEMYGDTSHMPGPYKDGVKEWSLPCFDRVN